MKKNRITRAVWMLFASVAMLTGCQNEDIVKDAPDEGEGIKIVATASVVNSPDTRMGFTDNATSMNFVWKNRTDADESFKVYVEGDDTYTPVIFTLKEGNNTGNGTFEGTIPAGIAAGTKLYAFYNKEGQVKTDPINGPYYSSTDLSGQALATSASGLDDNDVHLMYAQATYAGGNEAISFSFTHKVSILKVTMTFPEGTGAIKEVKLVGAHKASAIKVETGEVSFEDAGKGDIVASDAMGIAPTDNKLTAYLYLFPEDLAGTENLTMTATDMNSKMYSAKFDGRAVAAGKVYTKALTLAAEAKSYAIGDLFPDADNPVGIVCSISDGGVHGKAFSTDEIRTLAWAIGAAATTEIGANDQNSGAANMSIVQATSADWGTNYPAFKWCADHTPINGHSWYLPAVNEIALLAANYAKLKAIADVYFSSPGLGGYWFASSEHTKSPSDQVQYVTVSSGSLQSSGAPKTIANGSIRVRAMIDF